MSELGLLLRSLKAIRKEMAIVAMILGSPTPDPVLATYDIRREIGSLPHQLTDLLTTEKPIE